MLSPLRVLCKTRPVPGPEWGTGMRLPSTAIKGVQLLLRPCTTTVTVAIRPSTTPAIKWLDRITNDFEANEVVSRLTTDEQRLLHTALQQSLNAPADDTDAHHEDVPLTPHQTQSLFLVNALPFVGFGMLDNMIMIIAGEYIDQSLGAWLCLSTMAAAALGNLISDVAGVGLAHYVEVMVGKAGLKHPVLTARQLESSKARFTSNAGRAIGLSIGCLIGMFPLIFYDDPDKKEQK